MAAVAPVSSFPMDREAAEEEIALLVRKPGFNELTVTDIIRHMNNRFNINFDAYKKQLKNIVFEEIAKRNQEQGKDSESETDSDSDDEEAPREPKKDMKEEGKPAKHADSDSDSGVEDALVTKGKKRASKPQSDMASNIKSSRRAAASNAMKQIRNTSEGGRFQGRKKAEKDPNADMSGKFGPMTKLCYISTDLQQVTKDQWMKRCDVVKVMWDYIKQNNLQDPKNKQFFICDDVLETIFKKRRVKAFGMTKFLTRHIIGTQDMAPDMREEAEQEMDKRRQEWKERQRKRELEGEGSSKSDETEGPEVKKAKTEEPDDDEEEHNNKDDEESSSDSD